jgi:hypothetical protein
MPFTSKLNELSAAAQRSIIANAGYNKMTPENYLASRGGVNPVTGKFGDSFNPLTDLTDAEYKSAIAGKTGVAIGQALNAASDAKLNAAIASGAVPAPRNTTTTTATNTTGLTKEQKTAQQEFRAALTELGLADLATAVDKMITEDKTASQIKMELPGTADYKARFPGMAALKAAGQAISEATYIANERAMIQSAKAYGIDNALVTRDLLGQYIGGGNSPVEFERRVDMAANRVDKRPEIVTAMTTYFPGVDKGGMIAYLLNPTIGMDVIKKQVRSAEIGAAAKAGGFTIGAAGTVTGARAESLIDATGTKDLATLKAEFGQAGILGRTQERLAGIEGQQYDTFEAAQAVVGSDTASILASKKRAERETMFRYGGGTGISSTSLRSTEVF